MVLGREDVADIVEQGAEAELYARIEEGFRGAALEPPEIEDVVPAAEIDRSGPIGRALDFVVQEIGREVNTIGSKIQDRAATGRVLEAKGAVERLREQLQNLE